MLQTLLVLSLMPQLQNPNPQFYPPPIPYMLREKGGSGAVRNGYQEGILHTDAYDKLLIIRWTASPIANQQPNWTLPWNPATNTLGNNKAQASEQDIAAGFFATSSCRVDADTIMVAGLTDQLNTVIEKWTLGWPDPMPAPVTNISTGITSVSVATPSVTRKRRLYEANVAGKVFVRNLCAIRSQAGSPVSCLVQFDDSQDVYVLTIATSQLTLLASPVTQGGALGVIPGLAPKDHYGLIFGDRQNVGYAYTFIRNVKLAPVPGSGTAPVVIFVDSNRDGIIDNCLQLSYSDYAAQGWNSLENYANWWSN